MWFFWLCHPFLFLQYIPWFLGWRKPKYKSGQFVLNRYGGDINQELKEYIGPYVVYTAGYSDPHWIINEEWLTTRGDRIVVGYFYLLQNNKEKE